MCGCLGKVVCIYHFLVKITSFEIADITDEIHHLHKTTMLRKYTQIQWKLWNISIRELSAV